MDRDELDGSEPGRGHPVTGSSRILSERIIDPSIGNARQRGKLKIFFGYASGVGTSKAMLAAALVRRSEGAHVLYAGPGGLEEIIPSGVPSRFPDPLAGRVPFSIDDVIRLRPELLLLPEIARRSPVGSRHRKRYQDVEELLAAGIEVWTTLEVGQLESLADIVERVLSLRAIDRVPDAVFDAADDVELIDLAPEALLGECGDHVGPGYVRVGTSDRPPARATLLALREIALRRAADRLTAGARAEPHRGRAVPPMWPTEDRLVVCVGPSPTSARVIRTACRMARAMRAPWTAVTIEPDREATAEEKQRVVRHLQLAESLGAKTTTLTSRDIAREVIEYAREQGATKIVIGKTGRRRWPYGLRPSLVDRVIASSGEIDVYVIRGADGEQDDAGRSQAKRSVSWRAHFGAFGILAAATVIAALFRRLGFSEANLVLAYILGVTAVAAWLGRGPAVLASIVAVLLYNYFFTEPQFTLRVHDSGYIITFAVMMTIGLLVSTLMARIREQAIAARRRERRTEQLYELSRELSSTSGAIRIATASVARLGGILGAGVVILLPDQLGDLKPVGAAWDAMREDRKLPAAAEWAFEHGQRAGYGTETQGDVSAQLVPLAAADDVLGVLVVRAAQPEDLLLPEGRRLMETCAGQVAAALQRDQLVEKVHRTLSLAESEQLRNSMLSSISHDFRTPLSAIAGSASSLLEAGDRLGPEERNDLLLSVHDEAVRLARLVDSLLQMSRIEAGQTAPNREWNVVEDVVGAALTRMDKNLGSHRVVTRLPADLPMIRVDGGLIELVLINLLENAIRYSAEGTEVEIVARAADSFVRIEVADRGPGLTDEDQAHAFEKFYRGPRWRTDGSRGAGLGLAICAAIAKLHDGAIVGNNRAGGGAVFELALPLEVQPPEIALESQEGGQEEEWT